MFFYCKKIIYLSLMKKEEKKALAGFARFTEDNDRLRVKLCIKDMQEIADGRYPILLVTGEGEREILSCRLKAGILEGEKELVKSGGALILGGEKVSWESISGVRIPIDGNREICGRWKGPDRQKPKSTEPEVRTEEKNLEGCSEKECPKVRAGEKPPKMRQGALIGEGRWQQLLGRYRQVHPFGDERVFIAVEPKDLEILSEPYQKLANNSFLLHGFYNYRHMILGEDREMGDGNGNCYYLGVPGTYFEREKKVAVMFGFEGFESEGAVEIGKFGYYLRRVELGKDI